MNPSVVVGIFVFDDVEVLDFAGPYEVFSISRTTDADGGLVEPFKILLIAETLEVRCQSGMRVRADHLLSENFELDVLVVPGGPGVHQVIKNIVVLEWIRAQSSRSVVTASVCTGALALVAAGVLAGRKATTHYEWLNYLQQSAPDITVERGQRFVVDGSFYTAAGVTAGIDLALELVSRLIGPAASQRVAARMEYSPCSIQS